MNVQGTPLTLETVKCARYMKPGESQGPFETTRLRNPREGLIGSLGLWAWKAKPMRYLLLPLGTASGFHMKLTGW